MTFAISDVVGDDLAVIASGPTVPDASTYGDALNIVRQFGGVEKFPDRVIARFEAGARGEVPETPKPGDPRLARSIARVIGSRRDAMEGAATEAASRGYAVVQFDEALVGEARTAAATLARAILTRAEDVPRPACFVSSGETTVRVVGSGKGGRNQEVALTLALTLRGAAFAAASVGTDGIDGPTDAAGALVDDDTVSRAGQAGTGDPVEYLNANNTYEFFRRIDDLIRTGPTGTNVGDLQVVLLA
jgi:hydroxypyruvate reductase